jgi:hypothetical protein
MHQEDILMPNRDIALSRRELLAVIYGLRQFRAYLLGRHFILRTDHAPLTWLQRTPVSIGQQERWLDLLAEFSFDVEHRPGLSTTMRMPCPADLADNVDVMIWMTSIRLI